MTFGILKVKNWCEFQHYKKRTPPWIKLHRHLLDDYEFSCLPIASKAIAPQLWLLASESMDGEIECNLTKLAFRLRIAINVLAEGLAPLIQHGFFIADERASKVLAMSYRHAPLETEREAETEAEAESLPGRNVGVHVDRYTGEIRALAANGYEGDF